MVLGKGGRDHWQGVKKPCDRRRVCPRLAPSRADADAVRASVLCRAPGQMAARRCAPRAPHAFATATRACHQRTRRAATIASGASARLSRSVRWACTRETAMGARGGARGAHARRTRRMARAQGQMARAPCVRRAGRVTVPGRPARHRRTKMAFMSVTSASEVRASPPYPDPMRQRRLSQIAAEFPSGTLRACTRRRTLVCARHRRPHRFAWCAAFDTISSLGGHRRFCDGGAWRCEWCSAKADMATGKV